ncbi:MAG: hypothetical protein PHY34_04385 [Patescibacteria group bacterium]|nr:hypothetical protein [Patescibacteria group bacterium]MDD5715706.1 hypothetical protein [Patescibacteria group bacterium]
MVEPTDNSKDAPSGAPKQVRIHTMPDKFYIEDTREGGKKGTLLFILVAIFFLLVVGAGAFWLMQKYGGGSTNETLANDETNSENENRVNNSSNSANVINAGNSNNAMNTNSTSNRNSNSQIIANLFSNTAVNTNANMNVNSVATGRDTDLDGLTDIEEAIYGTSLNNPDTDQDTYSDGHEVLSGYNPNGTGKLENYSTVRRYLNDQYGYALLYPASWDPAEDPITAGGRMFSAPNGEFVEVTIESNPARISARDWYLTKSPGVVASQVLSVANWDKTLSGVKSVDGKTVYYTRNDSVYVITYSTTVLSEANYAATFEMLYKSFEPAAVVPGTNSNSNSNSNSNTNSNKNSNSNTNSNINWFSNSNSNTNTNTNTTTNTNTNSNSNTNSVSTSGRMTVA